MIAVLYSPNPQDDLCSAAGIRAVNEVESVAPVVPGGEGFRHHCVVDLDGGPAAVAERHAMLKARRQEHPAGGRCRHRLSSLEEDLHVTVKYIRITVIVSS